MPNFIQTDAGRDSSGFGYESNDCVVRAISKAYNISYDKAHETLRCLGRKDNDGFKTFVAMNHLGFEWTKTQSSLHMTVARFAKEYNKGSFVIRATGHAMAVVDGIIYDMGYPQLRRHVKQAWKVA